MKLSPAQLAQFDDLGYVYLPECFSPEEIAAIRRASQDVLEQPRPEVWREKDGSPRTAFACQKYNEMCRRMVTDERLVEPVEQLFGESVYLHQFKINAKAAFTGKFGNGTRTSRLGIRTTACQTHVP